jgi:hypothetical protein
MREVHTGGLLQAIKRSESNAIPAHEMAESFKDFSFELASAILGSLVTKQP